MTADVSRRFQRNLEQAKQFGDLFRGLSGIMTSALNVDDLLRAELVFSVSALDKLVHDVIEFVFVEMHLGARSRNGTFGKFCRRQGIVPGAVPDAVRIGVQISYGRQTFQRSPGVRQGLSIASVSDPFPAIATAMACPVVDVEARLNAIVERRNKIAHESDADPAFPDFKLPVTFPLVREATDFIEFAGGEVVKLV